MVLKNVFDVLKNVFRFCGKLAKLQINRASPYRLVNSL